MGGHAGGELAAQITIESLDALSGSSQSIECELIESIKRSRRKIVDLSAQEPRLAGMGTTLTAAFVSEQVAYWAHVGDSRLYLFRESHLVEVTEDHTIPGLLVREGEITRDEARVHPMRNVLLSCIGRGEMEVDSGAFEVQKEDVLILSTDGLHDIVPEERITSILRSEIPMQAKLDALISAALAYGGRDNITVIALRA